jgi:hypothetical protein
LRTASSRPTPLGLFFVTRLLLYVDPAILIRDAAAAAILVIVELGRQDDRLGWWRGFGASHAT